MEQELKTSSVLSKIRGIYSSLSSKEKTIADYILKNPKEIIHLSITEFADNSQVAEATIFRFCKRLGYRGYQAFKIALASEVVAPIQNIHQEITFDDEILTIARKVFMSNIEAMKDTLNLLNEQDMLAIIDALANAKRIDFYGSGGSAVIANDAYHKFIRTGIFCSVHTDAHLQITSASMLQKGDVAIAISHSGSNKDVVEAIRVAKESGAFTIGLTNYYKSPLAKEVDYVLYSTSQETLFRSEAMASRIVQLAIIDVLYVAVSLRRQNETLENLQKIREAIALKRY
ncbi:MurR/RpiR family transcriptional regulator [Tepidibacillus infernus]|uniref:MurR/RpiR family transcriptional regulator n=1 Tax=Tepidibacillus infernus TaxID=1806172 RepID=UPI003A17374C